MVHLFIGLSYRRSWLRCLTHYVIFAARVNIPDRRATRSLGGAGGERVLAVCEHHTPSLSAKVRGGGGGGLRRWEHIGEERRERAKGGGAGGGGGAGASRWCHTGGGEGV